MSRRSRVVAGALLLLSACGQEPPPDRIERVTANELYVAHRDNEVAAQLRFKGAALNVSGVISQIAVAGGGRPELYFVSPEPSLISAELDEEDAPKVAKMRIGQTVAVLCNRLRTYGMTTRVFDLSDCKAV
jgi:hypothetical protein